MNILFEDNHIIVLNKAAGDLVQGDKTGDEPLSEQLKRYLAEKYNKPGNVFVGVVHRLDRPVSGCVIFARTTKALTRLNTMLQNREIEKTYWAIVCGRPQETEGTLVHYMLKNEKQNKSYAYETEKKHSKKAVLHYTVLNAGENYTLLEIKLETGRHHQIRCQLAKLGCPIKGDLKYGAPRSNEDGGISLHARSIQFKHPVIKELISFNAPVPDDKLWRSFVK